MNEKLLQYIWQKRYFNQDNLVTEEGETITILHPGQLNHNQGPDFLETKIKRGKETWVGNTELHVHASDWHAHHHNGDKNYSNIILHVVWKNDISIYDDSNNHLPTIELESRVPFLLIERYAQMMYSTGFVSCEKDASCVKGITWTSWKERLLAERLTVRGKIIFEYLKQCNNSWEEVFWWLLAKNMGMKVNGECFEAIARSLPLKILARHKNQLHQIEALLLGQSALLNGKFTEDYPCMLSQEYSFLKKKYRLMPVPVPPHFLRMRPRNFPTIRLAQLAMLVYSSAHLFSRICDAVRIEELKSLLEVTANDYWHYHYRLDEPAKFLPKKTGKDIQQHIIINTIVPVMFAWGQLRHDKDAKEKSLRWLGELEPENNTITRSWVTLGISNDNAFDSQALLELKKQYCDHKKCLDCAIGQSILRK